MAQRGEDEGESRANDHDEARRSYHKVTKLLHKLWRHLDQNSQRIMALGTIALAIFAYVSLGDSRTSLRAARRAWLSPTFMHLNAPLENKPPISIQLRVENVGREPAVNVVWTFKPRLVPYIPEGSDPSANSAGPNLSCSDAFTRNDSGAVIRPSSGTIFWIPWEFLDTPENRGILGAVAARRGSLLVDGCIIYRIASELHQSSFRFSLRDVPDKPSSAWLFNTASTGNSAN